MRRRTVTYGAVRRRTLTNGDVRRRMSPSVHFFVRPLACVDVRRRTQCEQGFRHIMTVHSYIHEST